MIDKKTGLIKEKGGISLNADPGTIQQFGGAYQVMSVPPELKIVKRGKPGHYQIEPGQPMTLERFTELLSGVVLKLLEGPKP